MARANKYKVQDWAQVEFGAAELGDARRTARLVQLAHQLGERPEASLPQALEDDAALKAAKADLEAANDRLAKVTAERAAVEAKVERRLPVPALAVEPAPAPEAGQALWRVLLEAPPEVAAAAARAALAAPPP